MVKLLETEDDFNKVLQEAGDKLVVIDFTATWCGPCRMISPKFEAMSEEFKDAEFYKVDVDKNDKTAEKCGISAMPTFQFYKSGKKVNELTGADEAKLKELIQKHK